ncbi:hypothetical protein AKJ08_3003 [Vulgatibacter incomptus]|uniref:RelE/StbE replicon stabilization toxin n=2 Tax=Vulgatibacter incomptus TaxID=1391653 RepID=A0A0K1PGR2_9BACT|nr:hypothetical protein AKJ08_3003 [Vulgatibacter incomptus]
MPKQDSAGMIAALDRFAETGAGDLRKLKGQRDRWALRWGNWRAIYSPDGRIVRVLRVMDRKEVYR